MSPRPHPAVRLPHFAFLVFAAVATLAVFVTTPAMADTQTYIYSSGCFICKPTTGFFTKVSCVFPQQDGWGSDTCTETVDTVVLSVGPQSCSLSGNACMYDCYGSSCGGGGGAGGGSGGGGGGSCGGRGYCDPSCFDCGGNYY